MMLGVGFDAHVVKAVDRLPKRVLGKAAYVLAFAVTLSRFPYRRYDVLVDGVPRRPASVVICNGHFYGGRFSCTPDAHLDEPDLHVCLFMRSGRWAAVRYGLALLLGRLHRRSDVEILKARQVEVRGDPDEPVQCDGDLSVSLPLVVTAGDASVRFRSPARG